MKARTGYTYSDCETCRKLIDTGRPTQRGKKKIEYCECSRKNCRARWWARMTFVERGVRHNIRRRAANKSGAQVKLRELLQECDERGGDSLLSKHKRFDTLADHFKTAYLNEPVYVHGEKVSGLRSYLDQQRLLKTLRGYFGTMRIRDITPLQLEQFKSDRLRTPKRPNKGEKQGKQRAIASVNRELALLRQVLNEAVHAGWLAKNPFQQRRKLISTASEKKRERILTRDEEARLLAACTNPDRKHGAQQRASLKPIIICALDTGMRKGEIFKLNWSDVDFANSTITLRAFNTKTMKQREVVMTERLKRVLEAIHELSSKDPSGLCFGVVDNVKKSFHTVRKDAGLLDVRFHDLRHTAATRLIAAHIPLNEVGRILGHTKAETTYRYVNANVETARRAAAALDAFNEAVELSSESVN